MTLRDLSVLHILDVDACHTKYLDKGPTDLLSFLVAVVIALFDGAGVTYLRQGIPLGLDELIDCPMQLLFRLGGLVL